jgi:hypothetical protein
MKVAVPLKLRLALPGLAAAALLLLMVPPSMPPVSSPPIEHIAAVLLIIGCSDDLSECRELPAPASVFETEQECDDALPNSLGAFTGQFEQLYAQCLPVDPAMDEEEAELVWEVHHDGTLVATVEAASTERIESAGALVAAASP